MKMGVNEQLVVMIGYDVGCEFLKEDEDYEMIEKYDLTDKNLKLEVGIIQDGMDGEYCFVGIPIRISDKYEPLEDFGQLGLKEPTDEQKDKIIEFIKSKLNMNDDINSNDIKNYVFMHYT